MTTIAQGYQKNGDEKKCARIFDMVDDRLKNGREHTTLRLLLRSWNSVLKLDFHKSNELYLEYLKRDKTMDLSLLIYEKTGWFVMR